MDAANLLAPEGAEPYLLILGTREPRKNVILVFDMLARAPALLESHRFVFAGKMGWLAEQHALPESLKPAVAAGRIVFPGFVGDRVKYRLLAGAEATLYPSLFEGFGLPVLESLSAGTPCVASWSSSIPEVGGALCSYFDPLSATGMQRALRDMLARRRDEGEKLRAACRDHAARSHGKTPPPQSWPGWWIFCPSGAGNGPKVVKVLGFFLSRKKILLF